MAEERSIRMQNRRIHNRLSYRRRPQKHLFVRRHLRPREECSALQQEMIGPRLSRLLFRFLFWIFSSFTDHLFFFKYVSLEICNIQLHNCHIYSRKRIPSASCGQLSLFWLDVTFVMLLHPNESFSWRLIRCWYIQVFHVLVLRPSTSLTFALHLPLRLTHGTLQVITVRLNPLTGHNRQNHKNRPSRNPVGTQLRNIHVHTLRFLGFLWILFYIWAQLSRRETCMC